ncbi:MAG: single-stranded DNA-binding protein [Clostridia bacterium]|nr:single-stranded DNA-binding protein [Clostridia bacterium]
MNQVCLIGRLGADPEMRATQSGMSVARFSLAVNRNDEAKTTDWFEITCFGKVAETTAQYMKKGCQVGITARLQVEKWQDKQTGQNKSRVAIIAGQVDFLSRAGENSQAAQSAPQEGYDAVPF